MDSYKFFSIYQGIYLHFNSKYDFIKYGTKNKSITLEKFDNRKEKILLENVAKRINNTENAIHLCVANSIVDSNWIYQDYEDCKERLYESRRFYLNYFDNIRKDVSIINEVMVAKKMTFDMVTSLTKYGNIPPIIQLVKKDIISYQTVCLMNKKKNFTDDWINKIDPIIIRERNRVERYTPFLKFLRNNHG